MGHARGVGEGVERPRYPQLPGPPQGLDGEKPSGPIEQLVVHYMRMDRAGAVLVHPHGGGPVRVTQLRDRGQVTEDGEALGVGTIQPVGQAKTICSLTAVVLQTEDLRNCHTEPFCVPESRGCG